MGADCSSLPQVTLHSKLHELNDMEEDPYAGVPRPVGALSLLDTDLCKLTMQSAVVEYFPNVPVTYELTNCTPAKKYSRPAFHWLQKEIDREPIFDTFLSLWR